MRPILLGTALLCGVSCSLAGAEQSTAGDPPPRQEAREATPPPAPAEASAPPEGGRSQTKVVSLQPLGQQLSPEAITLVKTALQEFYGFEVKQAGPVALPRSAYYPPRKRYRAEKLLDFLRSRAPAEAFRVLGVTAVDISTTKGRYRDWGIMGLATLDGRVSVMSMFRCRRGSRDQQHAMERLGKVAVHEIGHTLGLEHCPTVGCLMEDARGTNTTTDREHLLCPRCRALLARWGYRLPPNPRPPWPDPTG